MIFSCKFEQAIDIIGKIELVDGAWGSGHEFWGEDFRSGEMFQSSHFDEFIGDFEEEPQNLLNSIDLSAFDEDFFENLNFLI